MNNLDRIKQRVESYVEDETGEQMVWVSRKDVQMLVKYVEVSQELDNGISDFTLHNDTVEDFRKIADTLLRDNP